VSTWHFPLRLTCTSHSTCPKQRCFIRSPRPSPHTHTLFLPLCSAASGLLTHSFPACVLESPGCLVRQEGLLGGTWDILNQKHGGQPWNYTIL
jgi:hypothetical protein